MKRILCTVALISLSVGRMVCGGESGECPIGRQLSELSLPDWHGNIRNLAEWRDSKVLVLVFLGTECPLANIYAPRLETLKQQFEPQGVTFLGIDSNSQDSVAELGTYARNHKLTFPLLKDLNNELADRLSAQRTPEVLVLDADRIVRYHGRIDDQYGFQTGAGYARPRLNRADLSEAVQELLAGKQVSQPALPADGCLIGRVKKADPHGDVTYSNQIVRILQNRCVECHRAGEVAPFALTSYDEIVGWGEMIHEVVDNERMPPWYANPAYGHFANDARLTPDEKELIATWVKNGCPEGDPSQLPPPRQFADGWQIGEPDQIIYMSDKPFTVPAEGVVEYTYFTADPGWTEDKWIQATECRPGDRSVVHHIIAFVDQPGGASEFASRGGLGGYAPGAVPHIAPEGTAIFVPANSKLRFQMHYTPNGISREDLSCIGVKFADPKTVKHRMRGAVVGNLSFEIPPGEDNYEVKAKKRFTSDTILLSLTPHMHLRGKDFRFELEHADGTREVLLDVPHWDFNWQLRYEFAEPKLVTKGSKLHCLAHFDNSTENLANPDPTKAVRFGDQTWEEMMFGFYSSIDPTEEVTITTASAEAAKTQADQDAGGE